MAAISEKNHYETERPAIVFAEMASVKSEPKASGADVFVLHEGTKVFVEEVLDNWKKSNSQTAPKAGLKAARLRR
jgi:hypothetical protein